MTAIAASNRREVRIADVVAEARKMGASDVHITEGEPPAVRYQNDILRDGSSVVPTKAISDYFHSINAQGWEVGPDASARELSHDSMESGPLRIHVYLARGKTTLAIRLLGREIPALESLGLPDFVSTVGSISSGIIAVTGETGSGKTTTLAAIVDLLNSTRRYHIITVEDPIEYTHVSKQSVVTQLEIGRDFKTYEEAMASILRSDPDVIVIGEARSREVFRAALKAADSGALVFVTAHTKNAAQTISRIIAEFPPDEQAAIRMQLSQLLVASLGQRLIKRKDKKGRVLGVELMIVNSSISQAILKGHEERIPTEIQTGRNDGMQTLDEHLNRLVKEEVITQEAAAEAVDDQERYVQYLKAVNVASETTPAETRRSFT